MSESEVVVPEAYAGARLDKALVALATGSSRAKIRRALDEGTILVNGRAKPKGTTLHVGDRITFDLSELKSGDIEAVPDPDAPLHVLHETPELLVVNKPPRQPCAPLRFGEKGTLANAVLARYPELKGIGYSPREPGLVHRLDNDTSGVLLIARTKPSFERLRKLLAAEKIHKSYLLVCKSANLPDEGTIEHPIANHPKDEKRVMVCIHPRDVMRNEPRPAFTRFRVLRRVGDNALVEVEIAKALRHQIRVHFASIDCPLLGDILYGGEAVAGLERHALHASKIQIEAENQSAALLVEAPLPDDLAALVPAA
jgi:23S rRNA pseudouridine1911/1915/1917 synthase